MSETLAELDTEHALVYRILRGQCIPRALWLALEGKSESSNLPLSQSQTAVKRSLAEIIDPLMRDAKPAEQVLCENACESLAVPFEFLWQRSSAWSFRQQLLVANLIPLYRGLATGLIFEAIQLTRTGLAQSLALLCLTEELGPDCVAMIQRGTIQGKDPHAVLHLQLNIQLAKCARYLRFCGSRWDHQDFDQLVSVLDEANRFSEHAATWASPDLLWRLAGELISKKSEFILPREWINTPVPWSSVTDHWLNLTHAMNFSTAESHRRNRANKDGTSPRDCAASQAVNLNSSTNSTANQPGSSSSYSTSSPSGTLDNEAGSVRANGKRHSLSGESEQPALENTAIMEAVVAKILLGEVNSHNDPAFISLVGRQLATCRSDDRSVSLLAIRVEPESEQDRSHLQGHRDDGLALWQQRLVNWLVDHPEVHDPYAFVCTNGELILCLMDIERNTATSLLRQGLIEVLTGNPVLDDSFSLLARVPVPARYHAGIASVSCPSAAFSSEQLISAAYRCLEAAQRHGRAAIKSIEVY